MKKLVFGLLALCISVLTLSASERAEKRVLIYTKNGEGYVHENIAACQHRLDPAEIDQTAHRLERYSALAPIDTPPHRH